MKLTNLRSLAIRECRARVPYCPGWISPNGRTRTPNTQRRLLLPLQHLLHLHTFQLDVHNISDRITTGDRHHHRQVITWDIVHMNLIHEKIRKNELN